MTRGNSSTTSVGDIVAATPTDRDRWADAIRAGSLLVVMLGHWFMVTVSSDGTIGNVLAVVPALQPITWVLQAIMRHWFSTARARASSDQWATLAAGQAAGTTKTSAPASSCRRYSSGKRRS